MELELLNNRPAITDGEKTILSNIYVGARYGGPMYNCLKSYENQSWNVIKADLPAKFESGECFIAKTEDAKIEAVFANDKIYIRTEIYNSEGKYIEPMYGMDVVALGGMFTSPLDRANYNGMRNTNGVRTMEMQAEAGTKVFADMETVTSANGIAFRDISGDCVNIGFITFEQYFSCIQARQDGLIECQLSLDSNLLKGGKTYKSDWIVIDYYSSMQEALMGYANTIKEFNNIELRFDRPFSGFCTWYYYLMDINERTIFENMEVLDKIKKDVPLEVFQIDDGWGSSHFEDGNGEKFPKGIKFYADYIKEHGMIAGIWLTPFNFGTWEPTVVDHPDWFLHNGEDLKLIQGCAIIDATNPEAAQYIRDMYHKITYDWGYRYIKLDHVATYLCGGEFYDPEAGALQNMRAYFKAMREGCHPDTFILACTSPTIELAGLVDGVRTSGDIFENWNSLYGVFSKNLLRWFTNGVLFWNDPDCLMLRTKAEEDSDCKRWCSRTHEENRTFATAMYVSGGALMISDKLTLANENMIKEYAKMFPRDGHAAIPLDLEDSAMPSIFDFGEKDGILTAAFINWTDRDKEFSITFDGTYKAIDHWDDIELGEYTDEYTVVLKPHCSQLIDFKKEII